MCRCNTSIRGRSSGSILHGGILVDNRRRLRQRIALMMAAEFADLCWPFVLIHFPVLDRVEVRKVVAVAVALVGKKFLSSSHVSSRRREHRVKHAKPSHCTSRRKQQGQHTGRRAIDNPTHALSIASVNYPPTLPYTPHTQLAHHASGYAAHRRLRARAIQAQLARPRFPSRYLPHHGRRHLHLRFLACRPGYPRTKVRFSDSNLPSQLSSRVQEQRKRWKNAQEMENTV